MPHLERQLQALSQGSQTCIDYLQSAKILLDQLVIVTKPINDEDLSYVINGIKPNFHYFITSYSFALREVLFLLVIFNLNY